MLHHLYHHGTWHLDALSCVGQQACVGVALVYLDAVSIPARHEQELSVGCDGEVARVCCRVLIADVSKLPRCGIYPEDGYAVGL